MLLIHKPYLSDIYPPALCCTRSCRQIDAVGEIAKNTLPEVIFMPGDLCLQNLREDYRCRITFANSIQISATHKSWSTFQMNTEQVMQ